MLNKVFLEDLIITFDKDWRVKKVEHYHQLPTIKEEGVKENLNTEKEKGQKFNEGKLHYHTVLFKQFPKALKEVVKRSEAGHIKYRDTDQDFMNYKRVENGEQEYLEAAVRHMTEEGVDEDLLEYGETLHEAAVIWNLLANLELKLERNSHTNFRGGEIYKSKK